ncbi:hypothetical protein M3Y99_01559300 [Aphelenchoides fujianensis]|nr:hypothetical protein M3Y99_01559300 [Aphelenchoides fujianensis]
MQLQHAALLLVAIVGCSLVSAAPIGSTDEIQAKVDALQEQMNALQQALEGRVAASNPVEIDPSALLQRNTRHMSFQPMKRMASWQPMKKSVEYPKEQIIRAIEDQLNEVLRAGETLGVSADDVLGHLRQRNAGLV